MKPQTAKLTVRIKAIEVDNVLSYSDGIRIDLNALNLLIGPNGSGKSNLIDVISLLRACTVDIASAIRKVGGVAEWIWKGAPEQGAVIGAAMSSPAGTLMHAIGFMADEHRFRLHSEVVGRVLGDTSQLKAAVELSTPEIASDHFVEFFRNSPVRMVNPTIYVQGSSVSLSNLDPAQSILAQRRDPDFYPELMLVASVYENIRIYREWSFGRSTIFRTPQPADLRNDYLLEDFSNLGLVLNRLRKNVQTKRTIINRLADLYDGLTDFDVSIEGNTVQVFLTEGDYTIPASRLSDGTLRYLSLLAILCDPNPASLICIEEPELGFHPDIIPKIADLLKEASERTQLIVTTHSDILIDAMSDRPECVLVCEKHEGQTTVNRLDKDELAVWLEKYRLGQLWTSGHIGGNRW